MSSHVHSDVLGLAPRTVGIWIELATAALATAQSDERIRLARGLVIGLDAIPEIQAIVVPCLPAAEPIMARLFADATRPSSLLSNKLRLVPAGSEPVRRTEVAGFIRRRRGRAVERLAAVGATPSPRTWWGSIAQLAVQPVSRPVVMIRIIRRIAKLARLALKVWAADVALAALGFLPSPHASIVADMRRQRVSAAWFLLVNSGTIGRLLPGPKILDLGGFTMPPDAAREAPTAAAICHLAATADALVSPSHHAAAMMPQSCRGLPVSVIPPVPLPSVGTGATEDESRRQLGDDLRAAFLGDGSAPPHRHFCDFPFERVEYLVAAAPRGETPVLSVYSAVLRRHRRNLKLVVDGLLPVGVGPLADVHTLGLSFDVAEAAGLAEPARVRLLQHARAVVVPHLDGCCLPPVFAEAVALGTPVVLGRTPAVRESVPDEDLSSPEYFDVSVAPEEGLRRAILHVLDHADEVLDRQRAILARLRDRTWRDVAAARLGLLRLP